MGDRTLEFIEITLIVFVMALLITCIILLKEIQ